MTNNENTLEIIIKISELQNALHNSIIWYCTEKYTEEEYTLLIGKYLKYKPNDIVNEIRELVKLL